MPRLISSSLRLQGFDYVKKIVYEIIETQQGKLGEEDNDDSCPESQKYDISGTLIGGLLSAVDSEEDEDDGKYHKLDESEVLGNMITFMVAGFDTTCMCLFLTLCCVDDEWPMLWCGVVQPCL